MLFPFVPILLVGWITTSHAQGEMSASEGDESMETQESGYYVSANSGSRKYFRDSSRSEVGDTDESRSVLDWGEHPRARRKAKTDEPPRNKRQYYTDLENIMGSLQNFSKSVKSQLKRTDAQETISVSPDRTNDSGVSGVSMDTGPALQIPLPVPHPAVVPIPRPRLIEPAGNLPSAVVPLQSATDASAVAGNKIDSMSEKHAVLVPETAAIYPVPSLRPSTSDEGPPPMVLPPPPPGPEPSVEIGPQPPAGESNLLPVEDHHQENNRAAEVVAEAYDPEQVPGAGSRISAQSTDPAVKELYKALFGVNLDRDSKSNPTGPAVPPPVLSLPPSGPDDMGKSEPGTETPPGGQLSAPDYVVPDEEINNCSDEPSSESETPATEATTCCNKLKFKNYTTLVRPRICITKNIILMGDSSVERLIPCVVSLFRMMLAENKTSVDNKLIVAGPTGSGSCSSKMVELPQGGSGHVSNPSRPEYRLGSHPKSPSVSADDETPLDTKEDDSGGRDWSGDAEDGVPRLRLKRGLFSKAFPLAKLITARPVNVNVA